MKLYMYDPKTREYKGSREAQILNNKVITKSAYATTVEPPAVDSGYIQVYNIEKNTWEIFEDHRQHLDKKGTKTGGTPFYLPEDDYMSSTRYIEEIGPLPPDALLEKPDKPFDIYKNEKYSELNSQFNQAENNGVIDSSVGFKIDATEKSSRDINGLIDSLEYTKEEKVMFCAADNSFHEVTLEQLKTMKIEVIQYGQQLYQKKWTYREQINQAQTKEDLDKIEIKF